MEQKERELLQRTNAKEMPLISNAVPPENSVQVQVRNEEALKDERDYGNFEQLDDEFVDGDMEGSLLDRGRQKKALKAPAPPQRSDKRAPRILENVMLELTSLDGSTTKETGEQQAETADPHELYLSSEEDASFSDYDDSDSLMDFEACEETSEQGSPASRASSRESIKDTARVVSFMLVGKPQIVEIYLPTSTTPPKQSLTIDTASAEAEIASLSKTTRRSSPLKLYPNALRRLSISSITSISTYGSMSRSSTMPFESTPALDTLRPRKSSRMQSNLASLVTSTKHAFLNSDPFPQLSHEDTTPSDDLPITPKTPTSSWKNNFSRTLHKARKQSIPKLSLAYTAGVVPPPNQSNVDLEGDEDVDADPWKQRQRAATTPQTEHDGLIRYEDIMAGVIKAPPPPPIEERERKFSLGMRGLTRRKSIKRDRYVG